MHSEKQFWEDFINIYRVHECLWNNKKSEYANRNMRNLAYEELIDMCKVKFPDANKDFVTKKIHTLRCSFRRELKKVLSSKGSGCSTDDLYTPTLWYFEQLMFIADCEIPRPGTSNLGDTEEDMQLAENNIPVQETQLKDVQQGSSQSRNNILETTPNRQSRKRKNSEQDFYSLATETLQNYNGVPQGDHFEIAGRKIACDFRTLENRQFLLAEKIMQDVLHHAKFGRLTENRKLNVNKDT